eukprot:923575-Karenia_brevis.AAC.1
MLIFKWTISFRAFNEGSFSGGGVLFPVSYDTPHLFRRNSRPNPPESIQCHDPPTVRTLRGQFVLEP